MTFTHDQLTVNIRVTPELLLRLEHLASACGYSRARTIRTLLDGAIALVEHDAHTRQGDIVVALNRWASEARAFDDKPVQHKEKHRLSTFFHPAV